MNDFTFWTTISISAVIVIGLLFTDFFAGHKIKGLLLAALGLVFSTTGYVITIVSHGDFNWLFIVNLLFVYGVLIFYISAQRLLKRKINYLEAAVIGGVYTLALMTFHYIFPIIEVRQVLVSFAIIYISACQFYLMLRHLKFNFKGYLYSYLILLAVVIFLQTVRVGLVVFGVINYVFPNTTYTLNTIILMANSLIFVVLSLIVIVTTSIMTRNQLIREQKMLEEWATIDYLTKSPNRRKLYQHIETLITKNVPFAIVITDIDGFKQINDQYGHPVGDAVLVEYSRRIEAKLAGDNFMARFGGDEFVFVYPNLKDEKSLVNSITISVNLNNFAFDNKTYNFSIRSSAGVALYPSDGVTISELLKNADQALYNVKINNRNNVGFFKDIKL